MTGIDCTRYTAGLASVDPWAQRPAGPTGVPGIGVNVTDADTNPRRDREPRLVVGIGASAGGLEPCRKFLAEMPADSGMAFVVVVHLDPTRESQMAEILGSNTAMPTAQASSPVKLEPDHVYVIAPDSSLRLHDGVLDPSVPNDPHGQRKPIDAFFSSMAVDQGERAVAMVFSGSGSNGSLGLRDVKAAGGLCIAQAPDTAQYQDMPQSAIATGVVDHVVAVEEIPSILLAHAAQRGARDAEPRQTGPAVPTAFELILDLLGRAYGVNFRGCYKRGTLERRTERRMALRQLSSWDAYLHVLQTDPSEVTALYRDLLIDVTQFFRDHEVWEYLEREAIPKLIAEHEAGLPLKLWVAGCATGEEAYSYAIVFLEQLARLGRNIKVQIFATDVAEDALATARRGRYPTSIENDVSRDRLERFFRAEGEHYEVTREVRDLVTFATHNLLADPPFSGLSLVSCRNVLIYLETHAQHRVLQLFHFSLKQSGQLILGGSETVGRHSDLFENVSTTARAYRPTRMAKAVRQAEPQWMTLAKGFLAPARMASPAPRGPKVSRVIEQIVLSRFTWACVAVTESFEIRAFFGPTHDYLVQPTGETRMDLLAWAKPGLYPRLRAGLERAADRKERVLLDDLWMDRDGKTARVECTIEPITPLPGEARLYLVAFREHPVPSTWTELHGRPSDDALVGQLEAELKAAREELQSTVEQLQTSNEEYRAGHEELLSLNEELQSNNEELQASKEELQSLNEEMVTINRQLEERNDQLRTVNTDITNLLVSTHIPIIFLDRELRIRRFTPAATEIMRLIAADVGRSVEDIKERIRDGTLLQDAKKVLDKLIPITTEVQTEDGHWYTRRIVPYRTEDDRIDGVCIAFYDITESKKAAEELDEARIFAETIVETTRTSLVVLDRNLCVVSANSCYYDVFHATKPAVVGVSLFELGRRQWDIPRLRARLERVLQDGYELKRFEVEQEFDQLGRRVMRLNARVMRRWARPPLVLLAIEDVTEHKAAQQVLEARAEELAKEHRRKDEFLAMLGHELRNPLSALLHGIDLLGMVRTEPLRVEQISAMMMRQAKRIGSMLDELLDIARLNAGKIAMARELVDVSQAMHAAVEAVTPLLELRKSKLRVSLSDAPGEVVVRGDLVRLTQVVENLLSNAAKYSEPGGEIDLSCDADDDWVRIRVRDTGIGMDQELLPHIFELFVQGTRSLDRAAGGLGLGLPLVKRVVEMHGGRVEASSPGRGQGSEFVVTLPRASEHREEQAQRKPLAAGDAAAPQRRILVVDDEIDAITMLTELLALHGHETRGAGDGDGALEEARSFRPDVVLLDLGLPKMDGYEVARRLRKEHGSQLRLVALTGYQKDTERLEQAGFDHHLIKPPDLPALLEWLRQTGKESTASDAPGRMTPSTVRAMKRK
jgi:two-component system CheB/CheR fusion protein